MNDDSASPEGADVYIPQQNTPLENRPLSPDYDPGPILPDYKPTYMDDIQLSEDIPDFYLEGEQEEKKESKVIDPEKIENNRSLKTLNVIEETSQENDEDDSDIKKL